jgi:hypothetical protein
VAAIITAAQIGRSGLYQGKNVMTDEVSGEIVIRGMTTDGRTFRPSDWAERLSGAFTIMDEENRTNYSTHVHHVFRAGLRCMAIEKVLERKSPPVYKFLMDFARENHLDVVEGRRAPRVT